MGISLVTYSNQAVSPQDDALVYQTAVAQSGIIYGATVTIKNATTLHIAAGHGIICGRKFTISAQDISVTLASSGTKKGRVYIHMDLSNTSTPIQFMTEVADSLSNVIQEADANITNGVYEFNLATFNVGTSSLSNLENVAPTASSTVPPEPTSTVTSKTLASGATTISFTVPTTGNYLVDFYTSTGVAYKAINTTVAGTVTLTFDAQSSSITVYCKVERY